MARPGKCTTCHKWFTKLDDHDCPMLRASKTAPKQKLTDPATKLWKVREVAGVANTAATLRMAEDDAAIKRANGFARACWFNMALIICVDLLVEQQSHLHRLIAATANAVGSLSGVWGARTYNSRATRFCAAAFLALAMGNMAIWQLASYPAPDWWWLGTAVTMATLLWQGFLVITALYFDKTLADFRYAPLSSQPDRASLAWLLAAQRGPVRCSRV